MMKRRLLVGLLAVVCSVVGFARRPHVVWIGIDGWASYCMEPGAPCKMPNLRGLMEQGTWSSHVRPVLDSNSGPNWSSQFCGVPECMHGFTNNNNKPVATPVERNEHGMFPTIFHQMRLTYPSAEIGVQHEWGTIKYLVDSLDLNHLQYVKDATQTVALAAQYICDRKPDLFYIHIDQVDHVGHDTGHRTPAYFAEVESVDKQVGQIIQATRDAGIYDNTVFVITSDHGGLNHGHGGTSDDELNVPVIYCGKGVPRGREIKQPVVMFDVAPTIAHILGVKVPASWRGKSSL